jgi:hypothetical protein
MTDFQDLTVPAEKLLEYTDPNRPEVEQYRDVLHATHAELDDRTDHAAAWARAQLDAEIERLAAAIAASDSQSPALERARAAFADAVKACHEAAAAVASAETVDTLLRAKAQAELAERAALRARMAFGDAATGARVPSVGMFPLYHPGLQKRRASRATETLARHARTLDNYRFGHGCYAVDLAVETGRKLEPEQMIFEVAAELDHGHPSFQIRWQTFAQRHGLTYERVDLHSLAFDATG